MGRRFSSFLVIILLIMSISPISMSVSSTSKNQIKVHYDSIVVDTHNDTMMKVIDSITWLPKIDIKDNTKNHIDIPKLRAGGLNVPFFAAYTSGFYGNTPKSISRTLALINGLYWTEINNRDIFKITSSTKQIEKTVKEGKIAAVPTIEGAYSLDKNNAIGLVNQYYNLGIRVIGLTWNYSNNLGEGASRVYGDTPRTPSSGGLTSLGKEVIKEMNRLGIIVDVSHMSENTFWDIINTTNAPIIASHSGVYSLKKHARNLNDEQLKAVKKNRGVISIVFYPEFLTNSESAYIKDYVDHIDYVVNLIGIDHVGIGSDFDGSSLPLDLEDSSELYKVTEELIRRNYKKEDIEKILGKNILRVLREVENLGEHNNLNHGLDVYIIPNYRMGEIIEDWTPLLKAKVESENGLDLKDARFKIIIDGISYDPICDYESSTLHFQVRAPLKENFHVVTFEVVTMEGKIYRQTRIFYIK